MVLTFSKQGNVYVAEFQLDADANLHVEREGMSRLFIHQRSVNGEYALVNDTDEIAYDNVVDVDLQGLVYPKWIKVSTADLPTLAEVVSSGEVTEIKSQSKEVEIVANGTTDVTPDAGYSYLSGVSVKVNVPQEGGGEKELRYYEVPSDINWDVLRAYMGSCSTQSIMIFETYNIPQERTVYSSALFFSFTRPAYTKLALAVDFTIPVYNGMTVEELFQMDVEAGQASGTWEEFLAQFTELTKEEYEAFGVEE